MEQYVIKGGNPLVGEVEIGGAKNAALAILSAAVMTDETVTIENVPNVRDTNVLLNAIEEIGAHCSANISGRKWRFRADATSADGRSICI